MTFKDSSNNIKTMPVGLQWYKTLYEFLAPVLKIVAVICAIFCCIPSAEGTNARVRCFTLLTIALVLIVALEMLHRYAEKRSIAYVHFQSKVVKRLNPKIIIPLVVVLLVTIIPFYILIINSFKHASEANNLVFTWWPKEGFTLGAYKELLEKLNIFDIPIDKALWNSFVYAFVPVIVGMFVSALSAYSFAKLDFPKKDLLYRLLIATMMMPGCVTMATSYLMYTWYGWVNSPLPLMVPGFFGGATMVMFLREYFMGISDTLLEAAKVDGMGKWRAFIYIMLPLAKPALAAQFVLNFITKYNDFMSPLIYLNDVGDYTIQIVLNMLNGQSMGQEILAAAAVISIVPMLILFVVFRKKIVGGIAMSSGVKG